jgi:hypothetical protein
MSQKMLNEMQYNLANNQQECVGNPKLNHTKLPASDELPARNTNFPTMEPLKWLMARSDLTFKFSIARKINEIGGHSQLFSSAQLNEKASIPEVPGQLLFELNTSN